MSAVPHRDIEGCVCVCVLCSFREIKFRKRAQSADDEGSVELAESLDRKSVV